MTIRTRLTLWYAGVTFCSLMLMAGFTYLEFAPDKHEVGLNEEGDESDFRETLRIVLWCGVPALVLAAGGGWWLMRIALAPVAALTEAAERITEHNLAERLPRTGNGDEMDRLTEVFNAMTERLDRSFLRLREFTLHASHELKTPLTVFHGELETALQEENPNS